jgi:hypothetical protein
LLSLLCSCVTRPAEPEPLETEIINPADKIDEIMLTYSQTEKDGVQGSVNSCLLEPFIEPFSKGDTINFTFSGLCDTNIGFLQACLVDTAKGIEHPVSGTVRAADSIKAGVPFQIDFPLEAKEAGNALLLSAYSAPGKAAVVRWIIISNIQLIVTN